MQTANIDVLEVRLPNMQLTAEGNSRQSNIITANPGALQDAISILNCAMQQLCHGSTTIWRKVYDARQFLEREMDDLVADAFPES